jgi:phage recombination protein Bet
MNALVRWEDQNQLLVQKGINESTWLALCSTIYPGAKSESILMAIDYCVARKLDIMLKPVHIVPMQVKNAQTGDKDWRDVPMPGIGLYRIQADRSGNYAGADEPEFGPTITLEAIDAYNATKTVSVSYPEWCKYTVYKFVNNVRVSFTAKEYWLENYAVQKAGSQAPNAMWKKRPFAQLGKCAEAQALRKAWPEIGSEPTAEEMEGKSLIVSEKDVTPEKLSIENTQFCSDEAFSKKLPNWEKQILSGNKDAAALIEYLDGKGIALTDSQKETINNIGKQS